MTAGVSFNFTATTVPITGGTSGIGHSDGASDCV
jgi:hypothetical protein